MRVRLPELPEQSKLAYEFDTETLRMRAAVISREEDGIYITVTNGFSAVFLPLDDCPPLVLLNPEPPPILTAGSAARQIDLVAFGPWESRLNPTVTVTVPGLKVNGLDLVELTLPATVNVSAPGDAVSGQYVLYVTGENCLPAKRWLKVN